MKLSGIDLDKEQRPVKSAGSVTRRPNNKKNWEDRWDCHDVGGEGTKSLYSPSFGLIFNNQDM